MKKTVLITICLWLAGGLFDVAAGQQAPQFKSTQEKEQWFKSQDSIRYAKKLEAVKKIQHAPVKSTSTQLVDEPGFPSYINTGDKVKDDANYKAAKDKWIQQYPDRYKEMTGQPK
jgi:hypothetical protein